MAEPEERDVTVAGNSLLDPSPLINGGSPFAEGPIETPSPLLVFTLWQAYLRNVNPASKVIHAPSVQELVVEAMRDPGSVSRNTTALLLSIYAAAVMSMSAADCKKTMAEDRKVLLPRYLAAAQQALAAAGLIQSTSFVLLQAFTIFLVSTVLLRRLGLLGLTFL